jgi:hypothetical protein
MQQAVSNSVVEKLSILREAIGNAQFAMHHREYLQAQTAVNQFLGRDALADQRQTEFEALSQDQKDRMVAARNYGIYGVFHLVSRPEVPLALSVVARELSSTFEIKAHLREQLENPEQVAAVTARFPEITPERIAAALEA